MASWDNYDKKQRTTDEIEEEPCWSSDVSNSDEEESVTSSALSKVASFSSSGGTQDGILEGSSGASLGHPKFLVLADYSAMSTGEVSLKEGDIVNMLKVGCAGWWFVKVIASHSGMWVYV